MIPSLPDFVREQIHADPALVRQPYAHGRTLLHDASVAGTLETVELLLQLGADANAGTHSPRYCLANRRTIPGAHPIVEALIRHGANVNSAEGTNRCTPLHMAARRGNIAVAQALLHHGGDPNARDRAGATPLRRVINCRKPEVAALLRNEG